MKKDMHEAHRPTIIMHIDTFSFCLSSLFSLIYYFFTVKWLKKEAFVDFYKALKPLASCEKHFRI